MLQLVMGGELPPVSTVLTVFPLGHFTQQCRTSDLKSSPIKPHPYVILKKRSLSDLLEALISLLFLRQLFPSSLMAPGLPDFP